MSDDKGYSFRGAVKTSMTFYPDPNGVPLLTISSDGFTVRGVKVEQGPGEAEAVYRAMLDLLKIKPFPSQDSSRG